MDNWLTRVNESGVLEWFSFLDDDTKSEMIINAIGQSLLGSPQDFLPRDCYTDEIRQEFYREDYGDWHSLITGRHIVDSSYDLANEVFLMVVGQHEVLAVTKQHDVFVSDDELKLEISQYYLQWRARCIKVFEEALDKDLSCRYRA